MKEREYREELKAVCPRVCDLVLNFRWPAEEEASGTVLPLRIRMQRVVVLGGRQVLGVGGR